MDDCLKWFLGFACLLFVAVCVLVYVYVICPYRRRPKLMKGVDLDIYGRSLDCPRLPRERDRAYRERLAEILRYPYGRVRLWNESAGMIHEGGNAKKVEA